MKSNYRCALQEEEEEGLLNVYIKGTWRVLVTSTGADCQRQRRVLRWCGRYLSVGKGGMGRARRDETRRQREAESSSDLSQVASPVSTSEQAMSLPLLARESQPTILDTTDNINRMYLHA